MSPSGPAPLVRRDHVLWYQDFVSNHLDSLGHAATATFVRVNARGVIAGGGQVLLPNAYSTATALQPASEAAIARFRTTHSGMTLGGVFSHRSYDDDSGGNDVLGPNVVWQATATDQIDGELLGSLTTAADNGNG